MHNLEILLAEEKIQAKPDYYVVGYGLDCGQCFRNLPGVYVIDQGSDEEEQEEKVKGEMIHG